MGLETGRAPPEPGSFFESKAVASELRPRRVEAVEADEVEAAVRMGPSAHHVAADDLHRRVAALAAPVRTAASFLVSLYRPLI